MADKTLTCRDCNATFTFSESEQAFFKEKGFDNEPQRCPECRAIKKQQQSGGNNRGSYGSGNRNSYGGSSYGNSYGRADREMFPAICAECGKETSVPFRPSGDKPVYCSSCFQSRR
jgi:CxxC-x17-CxxC domain-containing protein